MCPKQAGHQASGEQAPLSLLQRWAVCADPTKVTPSSPTS